MGQCYLLLGQDQANASTTFTDESLSANTLTAAGNVQYSTADPKFGTSAIEFDGTTDWIDAGDITDYLPSGDITTAFTFDTWINVDNVGIAWGILGTRTSSGASSGISLITKHLPTSTYLDMMRRVCQSALRLLQT